MILVSACLTGQSVRYDGRHSLAPELMERLAEGPFIALCPELLGGLGVPRPPARLEGARPGREGQDVLSGRARLLDAEGREVTGAFVQGAYRVVEIALAAGVERCYLKDRSPSCAHDPQGRNPEGGPAQGVLTALLLDAGLEVVEVRARAR